MVYPVLCTKTSNVTEKIKMKPGQLNTADEICHQASYGHQS